MISAIQHWLRTGKWRRIVDNSAIVNAYGIAFSTSAGELVLQHLLDNVYCVVYEGVDPQAALALNHRRAVVHEILLNIDQAQNPAKYRVSE